MDEYTSLAGASIVMPPHGKVLGLTAKRKIGDRKKQKRNEREELKKGEEDIIVHGRIQESIENKDAGAEGRLVPKDRDPEQEATVIQYGKRLSGKKRKNKIDLMI